MDGVRHALIEKKIKRFEILLEETRELMTEIRLLDVSGEYINKIKDILMADIVRTDAGVERVKSEVE